MTDQPVNVDNFCRAETARMFLALELQAGGVNRLQHFRDPTPLDQQPVIRQNRDTLYSPAVVDLSAGATLTLPDSGGRYLSVMVVNEEHYINRIYHEPGDHELGVDEFDTDYVLVAARILVDPNDPTDVAEVNALQDRIRLEAGSARPFAPPAYDATTLDPTRDALLFLSRGLGSFDRAFGRKEDVDPVKHLLGTAAGWGGLPEEEAIYLNVEPGLPVGRYELTIRDVPVDAFWSISVYNADGYFESTGHGAGSINSVTADRADDGSITVRFGDGDEPNALGIMDGWNYVVRLYRPRAQILDGSWSFPTLSA